eukprot:8024226-Alexandrium_andersonii.AAC.1
MPASSTSVGGCLPCKRMRVGSSVGASGPSRWTLTEGGSGSAGGGRTSALPRARRRARSAPAAPRTTMARTRAARPRVA